MAFTTALYLRISVDDENHNESDSIASQRDMLQRFVTADPVLSAGEILIFQDDGWSGTNFERPQVKELLELARRGGVNCILVKDMSRWGRSYVEVNHYLDQIFPFLGIRFISLGEGYDSDRHKGSTAPLDVAFSTIMHDVYSKEQSMKVRQSYFAKAKKGEYLCGQAPYGYVKSKTEKNKLVIDSGGAADVVRRVFALACEGKSTSQIAAVFNGDGIDAPSIYNRRRKNASLDGTPSISKRVFWDDESVRKLIINECYTGVLVSGKSRAEKPGSSNKLKLPKSEWIRVSGAHEAIVSENIFIKANDVITHFKVTVTEPRKNSIFAQKIKCGCCDRALRYSVRKNPYYFCQIARLNAGIGCFVGKLYLSEIKELVLTVVKTEAQKVYDNQQKARKLAHGENDRKTTSAELKRLTSTINQIEKRSIQLYESFADGKIDKDTYLLAKSRCVEELSTAEARADILNKQLMTHNDVDMPMADESVLLRILNATDVTDDFLTLINQIVVFDAERIEIRFAFRDACSAMA